MTPDRCRQCGGDPCACARQQAFPVPATQHNYAESGMTLLEYFAGQVVVIPAEGSPEWEALADRVWRAQMTAPKSRRVDGWRDTIDAVLRALTEGEKP